ncbi:MAG: hypothetical protein R3E56_19435 [Burkholderiaceae bacterium]
MLSRLQLLSAGLTALDSADAAETKAFQLVGARPLYVSGRLGFFGGQRLSAVPGTALGILKNPGFL